MDPLPALDSAFPVGDDAVASFRERGHVRIDGLASPEEVAAYRPVVREVAECHNREHRPLEERDTYGQAFLQVPNLWTKDERVRAFTLSPRFGAVAATLLGVPGVRLYHDQALFKEAGGGRTPWHQDQYYWPLDTDRTITMWMPLVDVPPEAGSMVFADGSHRLGHLGSHAISDESDDVFEHAVAERGITTTGYGAMAAGDATFHAGWTLHRAAPNVTGALREVMTVIWYADGARVTEPDTPGRMFDLRMWLRGLEPGDLAATDRNPLIDRPVGVA